MRRLVVFDQVTLDGLLADPGSCSGGSTSLAFGRNLWPAILAHGLSDTLAGREDLRPRRKPDLPRIAS
jgi:hypothetical protein